MLFTIFILIIGNRYSVNQSSSVACLIFSSYLYVYAHPLISQACALSAFIKSGINSLATSE